MKTAILIDWLSVTMPYRNVSDHHFDFNASVELEHGGMGYPYQRIDPTGAHLFYGQADPRWHIQYSGSALSLRRHYGMDTLDLLRSLITLEGKITRLDLALDVHNSQLDITELAAQLYNDQAITKSRTWKDLRSDHHGHTLYIGSRTSECYVRVYNKTAEEDSKGLNPPIADWTRIELELKGDQAKAAARAILEYGLEPVLKSKLNDHIQFPECQQWREAVKTLEGKVELAKSSRRDRNTKTWLRVMVMPTLIREAQLDHDFRDMLIELLGSIT